jgi:hypothetical protein
MNDARTKGVDEKFCSECGDAIKVKAEICPKYGIRQAVAPAPAISSRNKTVAGLLALFLGGIGSGGCLAGPSRPPPSGTDV